MVLESFWGSLGLILGALGAPWGSHGGSLGAPELPTFLAPFDPGAFLSLLELSWASFACFLLPKMALGRFWGRLWLVFGAPEGFLRGVFVPAKLVLMIRTAFPSFDTICCCWWCCCGYSCFCSCGRCCGRCRCRCRCRCPCRCRCRCRCPIRLGGMRESTE